MVERPVPEVLDQAALNELMAMVGDDAEFMDELVDTYLNETPDLLAQIRSALGNGSATEVVRPAHTLKGSSASIGAREVEGLSRTIEEAARADAAEVLTLADDLEDAYGRLVEALARARMRRWSGA
jgi:HPt (histidine-containing phosphotransfer) domain-containing protein